MEIKPIPFSDLPFGRLFTLLMEGDDKVKSLFATGPFDFNARIRSEWRSPAPTAALIRAYNQPFEPSPETAANIERLADPSTKCLVTGQQLTVFGGPLYTFFKIASTIATARRLTDESGIHVVPVFWLADEDHDYDEVASVQLIKGADIATITLNDKGSRPLPVADRVIGPNITEFTDEVFESLGSTDFTDELRQLIEGCYVEGQTHGKAFGRLIATIFGKHGLVLAGSNHPDIKKALFPVLLRAIDRAGEVYEALERQSALSETVSPRQAQVSDSLLFYLNPEEGGARERIHHDSGTWTAGESTRWTTDALIDDIMQHPGRFSPNVFLRPIMQDYLVPTLAYVAGPGEMAYYAQMKELYGVFSKEMPIITPRHSATIVEPAIRRLIDELPFEFLDYKVRVDELEKQYIAQHSGIDPVQLASDWLTELSDVSQKYIDAVGAEDPTLKASADKLVSEFESSIDRLKGKLMRSVKQKEQTGINRIRRVKTSLFPENGLQERTLSGIYFMNKYGVDVWDRLIDAFAENDANRHLVVDL